MNIDLLRHGECLGGPVYRGSADDLLSDIGWRQMHKALATDRNWTVVVSSPLRRCADFAQVVAERSSAQFIVDDRLREMHFGDWEGLSVAEVIRRDGERLQSFWQDPRRISPPNGESVIDMQTRVLGAWREISAEYQNALVITHGGPIRVILGFERDIEIDKLLQIDVPYAAVFRLITSRFRRDDCRHAHAIA